MNDHLVNQVREICLRLPDATEKLSHGEPTWFVKKVFCMFADNHHDSRVAIWLPAAAGVQDMLVESEPDKFFRPPYVGVKGWIGVYLDNDPNWEEIEGLILESYRIIAPPKSLAKLAD